ncbi:hypothetical protein BH23PAT2_BH23PAT2_10460 [soil metagenome]
MSEKLSVFNFERTIVDRVGRNIQKDIGTTALSKSPLQLPRGMSLRDEREAFLGWLKGKTPEDQHLAALLKKTETDAEHRLARWASLILKSEHDRGNDICLVSTTTPKPIVEAYADGIEEHLDIEIPYVLGRAALIDEQTDRFTGEQGDLPKTRTIESILKRDTLALNLFADSFTSGIGLLDIAKHRLVVNPDDNVLARLVRSRLSNYAVIDWAPDSAVTTLQPPRGETTIYNLDQDTHAEQFLADFYQ